MKKAILSTVLLSGLVLSVMAPTASAAVSTASGNAETDVKVNLKKDEGHEENNGEYFKTLAIVWKPTEFRFEGSATDQNLRLLNRHDKSTRQFIAVNDDRRVSASDEKHAGKGWTLTGKLGNLTNTADPNAKLNATMTVSPDELYIYDIGKQMFGSGANEDYIPKPIPGTLDPGKIIDSQTNTDLDDMYTLRPSFNMKAGGNEVPFIFKEKNGIELDEGRRGVFTNLGTNELRIAKPTAEKVGAYEGQITWTVADQP